MGSQALYRNTPIDAALGREAHQEQTGATSARVSANANAATAAAMFVGGREAQNETRGSAAPREAHLETATELARAGGTVSVSGLQRLGALLQRDENLARKLAKNPRRALASLDFISERDKQVLAGVNSQFWSQVAAVSGDTQHAPGVRALAGVAAAPVSIDGGTGYGSGGGTVPVGWDGIGPPQGRGIQLGSGVVVHPGAGGSPGGGDEGAPGVTDYGFGGGNAGDPSVAGHRLGGSAGGGAGGGGNPFRGNANPSGYVYGDPSEGGGISGGRLPSRAVLAGRAWKALNPGGDVSDNPKAPDGGSASPGPPGATEPLYTAATAQPLPVPSGPPMTPQMKWGEDKEAKTSWGQDVGGGAVLGGMYGVAVGAALAPSLVPITAFGGAYQGAVLGAVYHLLFHTPADPDLTGGGGGLVGPRARDASRSVRAAIGNEAIPNDFGSGSGRGARSRAASQTVADLGREAIPNDFGSGTGAGPRSHDSSSTWKGRAGLEAFPNDEGTGGTGPVGPSSRS